MEFTIHPSGPNPETFVWSPENDLSFVAGNEYSYEVILTRTGVQFVGTIKNWEVEDRGNVIAD